MTLSISQRGVELIKGFEGFKDTAYQDIVGVWTIGYGTTVIGGEKVKKGMTCTEEEACEFLASDVDLYLSEVESHISYDVNQNQVDSIASFIYNLGSSAFIKSTLLKKLNAGDVSGAAAEFMKWNKAGGKEVKGLTRRRKAEQDLFMEGQS